MKNHSMTCLIALKILENNMFHHLVSFIFRNVIFDLTVSFRSKYTH